MRHLFIISIFCLIEGFLFSQNAYNYQINLTEIKNDQITVNLRPPKSSDPSPVFCFPAMVPGTYSVYDFGRFIHNLTVIGKNGKELQTKKLDINRYLLPPTDSIDFIRYEVEDSWDTKDTGSIVFEPAGTKFDEGKEFILNNHGIFGYLSGMAKNPIEIEIKKPEGFYASTGLGRIEMSASKDVFHINNYHDLVDSPILYCKPDTTFIQVAGTQVLISVVSPNKKISSAFISRTLFELLNAQKNYLGGKLPVEKYAFLFHFTDVTTLSGSSGALEHSYSSMYVLFESDSLDAEQMIKDVAAHEFFHIVTPLNIHSEEIGNFDFNQPKMSAHLWMYEGMTEYAAHHVQVKEGLISVDQFLQTMQDKMQSSQDYFNDTLPFTKMSKGCLDSYKSQYNNVYEKGALIGMCLDILLRYKSEGRYGTQDLMADLSRSYGKDVAFKDEELFPLITRLTFPEIGDFLTNCVGGSKKLPFESVFKKVGFLYIENLTRDEITLGGIGLGYNPISQRMVIENTYEMNEFGKKMKFKDGDEIVSFNKQNLNLGNVREIFTEFMNTAKVNDKLEIEVIRTNKRGKEIRKKLAAKIIRCKVNYRNHLELDPDAGVKEIIARNTWLGLSGR